MGERRGVCSVLVGKPEGKRALGRRGHRWEDNINCILRKLNEGCGLDRPGSGEDRWQALVNAVLNLWCSIKCGELLD